MKKVNNPFQVFRVSVPDGEYSRRADAVEKLHYDALQSNVSDLLEALQKIQFRCECFIEDDRDMSISSTEMIKLICDEAIAKALTPQS